jgi:hypothetical protein
MQSAELDVDEIKIEQCQGELETKDNTTTEGNDSTVEKERHVFTGWGELVVQSSYSVFACFLG